MGRSNRPCADTMSGMSNSVPSKTPADMLRRIRELQAAGPDRDHVTEQHVVSKVLLKRFAEPDGPDRGLICPFRLQYPRAGHRLLGPDGCGKVTNFVSYASASIERLWKETEDKLPDALEAMETGRLFRNEGHAAVIKSTIALHFARSKATRVVHSNAAASAPTNVLSTMSAPEQAIASMIWAKSVVPSGVNRDPARVAP